ncbi:hypothetical protein DXD49_04275 [Collinsella sp. TM05-38]|nr:hypothetical protein DXD49_04275 [Collinsella sp. TM05-38]
MHGDGFKRIGVRVHAVDLLPHLIAQRPVVVDPEIDRLLPAERTGKQPVTRVVPFGQTAILIDV